MCCTVLPTYVAPSPLPPLSVRGEGGGGGGGGDMYLHYTYGRRGGKWIKVQFCGSKVLFCGSKVQFCVSKAQFSGSKVQFGCLKFQTSLQILNITSREEIVKSTMFCKVRYVLYSGIIAIFTILRLTFTLTHIPTLILIHFLILIFIPVTYPYWKFLGYCEGETLHIEYCASVWIYTCF